MSHQLADLIFLIYLIKITSFYKIHIKFPIHRNLSLSHFRLTHTRFYFTLFLGIQWFHLNIKRTLTFVYLCALYLGYHTDAQRRVREEYFNDFFFFSCVSPFRRDFFCRFYIAWKEDTKSEVFALVCVWPECCHGYKSIKIHINARNGGESLDERNKKGKGD